MSNEEIQRLREEIQRLKTKPMKLSEQGINDYVAQLLADKYVNSPLIPDFIEKKIYTNVVTLILGILKDTINSTSIDFIGNKVTLHME